jgi:hypothetical protein
MDAVSAKIGANNQKHGAERTQVETKEAMSNTHGFDRI